jgi:hypothetical protein
MLELEHCMEIEIAVKTPNVFDILNDEFADVEGDDIETYNLYDEGDVLELEDRLADLIVGETFKV